jgi:protein-S-isoprenylcysteine O-methyltransferase Ste14
MSAQSDRAGAPPASDVSPWVGVSGLVTLAAYILLARHWPDIVTAFGLPGPHARLSGPYSSVLAMVLTGLVMAAWSIFVDKVHRNPSTGIDWSHPRSLSRALETAPTKLAGLWATWAVIGFAYCLGRFYWDGQFLFAMEVIGVAALPLFVLSIPYVLWLDRVLVNQRDGAWHFGALLIGREAWDIERVKKHWRAWVIKGFFSAFMISILPPGFAQVVNADFSHVLHDPVYAGNSLLSLMFVVDVQVGTVGYLLTMRPLDAHIRSGNPFLAGWVAALVCYPPFVYAFMGNGGIIQYEYNTADWAYWFDGHTAVLWAWAALLVLLTAFYAWATVAFGIRFSNLTYRGVLTNGPYRFTRHPAYFSKNIFWWLSSMPMMVTSHSWVDVIRNTAFIACVSGVYYWRARTEEMHLLAEDAKYREYHAWMQQHGLITAPLARLLGKARAQRAPIAQPAE